MKISKTDLVKLIIKANNQGYNLAVKHADRNYDEFSADFREAIKRAQDETEEVKRAMPEALASAKSQAYDQGYRQGLGDGETHAASQAHKEGYARGVSDGKLEEENRVKTYEPKLSVWFMPIGALGYPPGIDKIKAIKAIREAYGNGEGYGLKDVKDLVEIEPGTHIVCGQPLPQRKAVELYLQLQAAGFEVVLRKP